MNLDLKGIVPPIITPFSERDHEIDGEALREHIAFLIEGGVHGIFASGTSGEFFSLTSREREKVNNIVVEAASGKVTVFVGTGTSGTKETIELTKHAKDIGADAAVVIAPYFTRTTERGLLKHYDTVAKSVDIPIVVYNIPGRAGLNIEPQLAAQIAEINNVVGIKDSSASMIQFSELLHYVGDKIAVFQGEDQLILESLVLGAQGAVPAVANVVPKLTVALYKDFLKNRTDDARKKQMQINRIMRECLGFRPWPVGIKETLNLLGRKAGPVRSPLVQINEVSKKKLKDAVAKLQAEGLL